MQDDLTPRRVPTHRSETDGWLGTPEFPGYRAGSVVARLDHLPQVYPEHLYFHLVLLDPGGQLQDSHSGPCYAISRRQPPQERSCFVRVVAELLRHAPSQDRGLSGVGQALTLIREQGVEIERLRLAAQLLDDVCSESAVVASLIDLLEMTLGPDEAPRSMNAVVEDLARDSGFGALDVTGLRQSHPELAGYAGVIDGSDLVTQVSFVVATIGKARARRYLRNAIDFEMVPMPQMLGV